MDLSDKHLSDGTKTQSEGSDKNLTLLRELLNAREQSIEEMWEKFSRGDLKYLPGVSAVDQMKLHLDELRRE